jgi:hypothetical protein
MRSVRGAGVRGGASAIVGRVCLLGMALWVAGCGRGGGGQMPAGGVSEGEGAVVASPAVRGVFASPVFARVPEDALFAGAVVPSEVRRLFGGALGALDRGFAARWGVTLTGGESWQEAGLNTTGAVVVALREGPRREVLLAAELAPDGGAARALAWVNRLAARAVPAQELRWEREGEVASAMVGDGLVVRIGDGVVEIGPAGWRLRPGGLRADPGFARVAGGLRARSGAMWARMEFLPWSVPFARGEGLGGPLAFGVQVDSDVIELAGRVALAPGAVGRTFLGVSGVVGAFEGATSNGRLGAMSVGVAPGKLEAVVSGTLGQEAGRAAWGAVERWFGVPPEVVLGEGFGGAVALGVGWGVEGAEFDGVSVAGLPEGTMRDGVAKLDGARGAGWRFEATGGALTGRRLEVGGTGQDGLTALRGDWQSLASEAGPGLVALGAATAEGLSQPLGLEVPISSAVVALRRSDDALEVRGRLRLVREGALGVLLPRGAFEGVEGGP